MQDLTFTTKISGNTEKGAELRGTPLHELINEANFVSTLFLSITGRKPSDAECKLLNAMLVASIDHGIEPASGFVPRVIAASGNSLLTAMASTLLALGPYHGGAISDAMRVLEQLHAMTVENNSAAQILVQQFRSERRRFPGFGHAVYKDVDPRTQQLFQMARELKLNDSWINLAQQLEQAIETELERKLVINIDGAMATLLLTLGFESEVGNAIFAVARVAGSIAHIREEQSQEKWVRRLPADSVAYDPS
jgi:citrate synthase